MAERVCRIHGCDPRCIGYVEREDVERPNAHVAAKAAMNAAMMRAFDGSTGAGLAEAALAALASASDVRAALVADLLASDIGGWWKREAADNEDGPMPGFRPWPLVDAILAALRSDTFAAS